VARIRIAACQLNPMVGDLEGNAELVVNALERAEAAGADVAIFPELVLTGYPPEDLLLKPGFISDNLEVLQKLAARTGRCAAVIGFVDRARDLHNAAAVCANGSVKGVYRKRLLPNYAVFDEQRYFAPGTEPLSLYLIGGVRCGVSICEDIWSPAGPVADQAAGGAELILNLNASPYYAGRAIERERMLATRATDDACAIAYVNQVGGQDELVFDGGSLLIDADGSIVAEADQFVDDVLVADLDVRPVFRKRLLDPRGRATAPPLPEILVSLPAELPTDRLRPPRPQPRTRVEEVYDALVLGTRDYVTKNGFREVVIGMSGGIDSSLVTTIAVDALGAEHVHGVSLPSRFTSDASKDDAAVLAQNLGIDFRTIAIEEAQQTMLGLLQPAFAGMPEGVAEENLQGRIRMALLMALNHKLGWLVLICGNKSELAVGYTTVFGVDMAGGFAVIKDVFKTLVFDLCRLRNERAGRDLIPQSVLTKPPSAELRPDQRDDQSLPPYEVLDPIIEAYVEKDLTANELIASGCDADLVHRIVGMIDRAEWKRRQSAPGVRVTPKAFGKDRRLPITNGYRG
jgi:NAD+ synthase (glutamine-hydrolysing)